MSVMVFPSRFLFSQNHLKCPMILQVSEDGVQIGVWPAVQDQAGQTVRIILRVINGIINVGNVKIRRQIVDIGFEKGLQPMYIIPLVKYLDQDILIIPVIDNRPQPFIPQTSSNFIFKSFCRYKCKNNLWIVQVVS